MLGLDARARFLLVGCFCHARSALPQARGCALAVAMPRLMVQLRTQHSRVNFARSMRLGPTLVPVVLSTGGMSVSAAPPLPGRSWREPGVADRFLLRFAPSRLACVVRVSRLGWLGGGVVRCRYHDAGVALLGFGRGVRSSCKVPCATPPPSPLPSFSPHQPNPSFFLANSRFS